MHYLLKQFGGAGPAVTCERRSGQPQVLLIDDTPFFREAVGRYLKDAGIAVTSAVDGQDGLQKLAEGGFDMIISDLEMPLMDGSLRRVRQQATGPLLALSLAKADYETQPELAF
jgi:CheY-like chemotaxis protein